MAEQPDATETPTSRLKFWSDIAENLGKVIDFAVKLAGIIATLWWFGHGWLQEQVYARPRGQLHVVISVAVGLILVVFFIAWRTWRSGRKWQSVGWRVVGMLLLAATITLWYLMPSKPEWIHVDVPDWQAQLTIQDSEHYVPYMLIRRELEGRNQAFPGGGIYRGLLATKRNADKPGYSQWVGYYAPSLFMSTLPRRLTLKSTGDLAPLNASVGVYLFIWNKCGEHAKVLNPRTFGYRSLEQSVEVNTKIKPSQQAAMIVFIYPWDQATADKLPATLTDVVDVQYD
jgi:hypothetical protein